MLLMEQKLRVVFQVTTYKVHKKKTPDLLIHHIPKNQRKVTCFIFILKWSSLKKKKKKNSNIATVTITATVEAFPLFFKKLVIL